MQPHQQRVLDEHNELVAKLNKLGAFIRSEAFDEVDLAEQRLLIRQQVYMDMYASVLGERMASFT